LIVENSILDISDFINHDNCGVEIDFLGALLEVPHEADLQWDI
jgi:hypothetical protein